MGWRVGKNRSHEERRPLQDVPDDCAGAGRFYVEAEVSQVLLRLQCGLA